MTPAARRKRRRRKDFSSGRRNIRYVMFFRGKLVFLYMCNGSHFTAAIQYGL